MPDAIETIEHAGQTIIIEQDNCDYSPRENDNICVFHIGHSRYSFGDENYSSIEDIQAAERKALAKGNIVLPLRMYDHSGITISLGNEYPYNDRWDSCRCGFVEVRKSEMIANFGKTNFTKKIRDKCPEIAEQEVKELDSYLRGEVYCYNINDGEETCGNYIGDIKYCIDDAKSAAEDLKAYKEVEAEKARIAAPLPLFPEGMAVLA
jgi:hypothetical protein